MAAVMAVGTLLVFLGCASGLTYAPPAATPSPRRQSAVTPSLHAPEAACADDEVNFAAWLSERLAQEPGADQYPELFAEAVISVCRWRRRYRGNQRLWRSLMKADRVIKEIVEAAPVLAAAREVVAAAPAGEKFTVIDLCSGKGFLSMALSDAPAEHLALQF